MKKIVLMSGKAQNGKSESGKILKNILESKGNKVVIIPFAKYLKLIMKDYMNWDGKTKDEWFRSTAQILGTDKIRIEMKKPLFHVSRICDDIEIIKDYYDYVIIDDWRYVNEYAYTEAIFPKQVITVRVTRKDFVSPLTPIQQSHISETQLDDFKFDYYLASESGIDNLEIEVSKFAEKYFNIPSGQKIDFKDLVIGDIVKIKQISDPLDADHLIKFVNTTGTIWSYIKKSGKYRYKVLFEDKDENCETHYFLRDELELVKKYNE